jgi:hypothetical protein
MSHKATTSAPGTEGPGEAQALPTGARIMAFGLTSLIFAVLSLGK